MRRYTKADLEQIIHTQLQNLDAMHDLLRIMKVQNELIENANKKLRDEISEFKDKQVRYPTRKKSRSSILVIGWFSTYRHGIQRSSQNEYTPQLLEAP